MAGRVTWTVERATNMDEVVAALENPETVSDGAGGFLIPKLAIEDLSPAGGFVHYPTAIKLAHSLLPDGVFVRITRVE